MTIPSTERHWKDTAIDCMRLELVIARKQVNDLETDRDCYREILSESLALNAELTVKCRALQVAAHDEQRTVRDPGEAA